MVYLILFSFSLSRAYGKATTKCNEREAAIDSEPPPYGGKIVSDPNIEGSDELWRLLNYVQTFMKKSCLIYQYLRCLDDMVAGNYLSTNVT